MKPFKNEYSGQGGAPRLPSSHTTGHTDHVLPHPYIAELSYP